MNPDFRTTDTPTRVLLLEGIHPDAAARLRDVGYEVEESASSLTPDELRERLQGVNLLGIRSKTHVTVEALQGASELTAIGVFGVGTNQVDLEACLDRGIAVFNAPFSNTRSVVELAIGLMIGLMRDIYRRSVLLHEGEWRKRDPGAHELRGKRLGIVGYGNIGSQLSVLAEALGMEVRYFDLTEKLPLGNAKPCRSLDELLETSDVITLHVDGRAGSQALIGAEEIARMKEGAVLINLARGFVVDLQALRKALEEGKLRGAAVDAFPKEPKSDGPGFTSPLQGVPNVILTPHIGGNTREAQRNIAGFVPEKLIDFLMKGTTTLSVNFPNLQLPGFGESHRVVHVHRNAPGVLAKINRILADREINITGQYLKTNERIGYVITDIGLDYDDEVVARLGDIDGTIRLRVLS